MRPARWHTVVRHLHTLAGPGEATDSELLERFTAQRQESAFAALVRRHGPMVLGVCRRILGNAHDAEDAFQATFLVLVRKASTIRTGAALGGWLHEVATRLALRARASAANRRLHEQQVPHMAEHDFLAGVVWRDLQPVLDEEVQRLPAGCREAFVLCCLEGKTYEQAAQELGCRPGTLSRRLARARELLRSRLARRGLVLPAGLLATALTEQAAPAAVPAPLISSTVKAALASAAGAAGVIPARIAALAEGGLQTMKATTTKSITALALAAGLLLAGAAALAHPRSGGQVEPAAPASGGSHAPGKSAPPGPSLAPLAGPQQPTKQDKEAPAPIMGRVVDANGKPVAGADVGLVGGLRVASRAGSRGSEPRALVEGKTGADGRFRLTAPQAVDRYWTLYVLARARGHGLGSRRIEEDKDSQEVAIDLAREEPLRVRLVDLQGQPAAGVKAQVLTVVGADSSKNRLWARLREPTVKPYWPEPAVTDAEGRFTLRGLGSVTEVVLQAGGDRYALHELSVTKPRGEVTLALTPARTLEGTVTFADTGKPVLNARLRIASQPARYDLNPSYSMEARTDDKGRFRVVPHSGGFFELAAYPPEGSPYLLAFREVNWPKADVIRQQVDLKLTRGIVVRGVVTEQPGGKPVAGATVQYNMPYNSPFYKREFFPMMSDWHQVKQTGADGKFEIVTRPGPGHLFINGPTPDYLHEEIITSKVYGPGVGPNRRHYPDGLVALDLKPEAKAHEVAVTLRRGVTLKGRVLRPDGKPVDEGALFCHTYLPHGYTLNPVSSLPVRKGRFELPGFEPEKAVPVYFYSGESECGVMTELSAAKGEVTVQLKPCGSARARFVDEKGKPLADLRVFLEIPVTSGPSFFHRSALTEYKVISDSAWMANVDSKRQHEHKTDSEGRVSFAPLIPGVRHRIVVQSNEGLGMFVLPTEFTVEPGKTKDLKDLTVKAPR
ncbi:MAG: sigma-70 family RNA polymerase sigma factor [Gemmataceae bacterium]|nr:sigma-70 family RNA polymerase sigma factor [Gemmataceae bacterium]